MCSVMCDSLLPQGLQPVRFLCPWNFPWQEYWSGLPFPTPGDLPNPGIEPRSPALQADALPAEPQDCMTSKMLCEFPPVSAGRGVCVTTQRQSGHRHLHRGRELRPGRPMPDPATQAKQQKESTDDTDAWEMLGSVYGKLTLNPHCVLFSISVLQKRLGKESALV